MVNVGNDSNFEVVVYSDSNQASGVNEDEANEFDADEPAADQHRRNHPDESSRG